MKKYEELDLWGLSIGGRILHNWKYGDTISDSSLKPLCGKDLVFNSRGMPLGAGKCKKCQKVLNEIRSEEMVKDMEKAFHCKAKTFTVKIKHEKEVGEFIQKIEDAHKAAANSKLVFRV